MKIGINYLKLKDIKPGTVLTIVEFSDIEKRPSNKTVDALMKLELPAGVDIEIKL